MKFLVVLASPAAWVLLILLCGTVLLRSRWAAVGRATLSILAIVSLVVVLLPVEDWALRPLEERFPVLGSLPGETRGVIVLGGGEVPGISATRGIPTLGDAGERLWAIIWISREVPGAQTVFSGGGDSPDPRLGDAFTAKAVLGRAGVDTTQITFDADSRSTRESALRLFETLRPKARDTWMLVTSASHMPRSVATFQAAGWRVRPYPVDFRTTPHSALLSFDPAGDLAKLELAAREWCAIVYCRLRGWTPRMLPARSAAHVPDADKIPTFDSRDG